MPRPSRCRRICDLPEYDRFAPDGAVPTGEVLLTLDEFEVLRLMDYVHLSQAACAARMGISRATVAEIPQKRDRMNLSRGLSGDSAAYSSWNRSRVTVRGLSLSWAGGSS